MAKRRRKSSWGFSPTKLPSPGWGFTPPPPPPPPSAPPPKPAPKPVAPFMTGEDMMALAQAQADYKSNVYNLDYELEKLRNRTAEDKRETETGRVKGVDKSQWGNAARGLAQSSIRDAELYDINATAAIRKRFLDQQLSTANLNTQRMKEAARHAFEDIYMAGLRQKMIQNAKDAMALQ